MHRTVKVKILSNHYAPIIIDRLFIDIDYLDWKKPGIIGNLYTHDCAQRCRSSTL